MNTRTVLLWHNNGEERIYFTVNPARLTVTRPNENRVRSLAMGGTVNIWGGRGLREVRLTTFLPSAYSPFFDGKEPESILAMLKSWQDSGDPVRLIISGSDINDAFLIEDVTETLREGDGDITLTLHLREYKFSAQAARGAAAQVRGAARTDERVTPRTWTVKRGDTLWGIACTLYGDGTRWRELARKNGVSEPRRLPIGKVLVL